MLFLAKVLKVVAMLPSVVMGVESFHQALGKSRSGDEKRQTVIDFAAFALGVANQIAPAEIVDAAAFHDGLKKLNDGIVQMLNASIWHKRQA